MSPLLKRILISVAALAVALSLTGQAIAAASESTPTVSVGVYLFVVDPSGKCAGTWPLKVQTTRLDKKAPIVTRTVLTCNTSEWAIRAKVGTYKVCLAEVDPKEFKQADGCKTVKVKKGLKSSRFILTRLGSASGTGSSGAGAGGSQSQGSAQGANTEQAQACKSGDNSACSNNANANTNQQTQQQQTTVIVNVPSAPAAAAPSISFLNAPAHRFTGSPSNAGTENYCVQTTGATSVTISNSVAQDTVGPVQDRGAGKFCFDFTPMQTSLFPAGFTVVWDTLTATATGPGGTATATASVQVMKPTL